MSGIFCCSHGFVLLPLSFDKYPTRSQAGQNVFTKIKNCPASTSSISLLLKNSNVSGISEMAKPSALKRFSNIKIDSPVYHGNPISIHKNHFPTQIHIDSYGKGLSFRASNFILTFKMAE